MTCTFKQMKENGLSKDRKRERDGMERDEMREKTLNYAQMS